LIDLDWKDSFYIPAHSLNLRQTAWAESALQGVFRNSSEGERGSFDCQQDPQQEEEICGRGSPEGE
jgi:hypothetical protein